MCLCAVQRCHVQKQGEEASLPYDDLTACLRMCGMSLKAIHAMHSGEDQESTEMSTHDSMLQSPPLYQRIPSMGSTNAGELFMHAS